ncbi:type III-B CRISPR module-associated protein Cmr3 [Caldisericum exile]|uniref:type III-B CRISPR module-associated protein Cmr3 n=1 Tax=Caldisericum exile TaxID=693075 RepID=UPI003C707CCC
MFYKIKPLDTLFFKDGRPFTMGAETWANPVFPPYPSTVYGAIRTWLIFERGDLKDFENRKFEKELGEIKRDEEGKIKEITKGSLKIKGPLLALEDTLYFPVPKDLLKEKGEKEKNLYDIDLVNKPEILISDYNLEKCLVNKRDIELEEADELLDIYGLKDYLEGKGKINYTEKYELFTKELKTGIKRSRKTLSTEEGYLYRIPMIKLYKKDKEASLYIEIEGITNYPEKGLIQLGGEGKTAQIEKIQNNLLENLQNINFKFENKIFKIYLATPAIFRKGWVPDWIDENNFEGVYKGIKLKLIACAIGKHILVGGWDLVKKKPKPMYKAVPAGSVYYFEILDDSTPDKIKNTFHLKNISDINPEEGFGLSLIGEV